jgi:predicted amino acid racemase
LIQLVLYKQLLEAKFKHKLDYISGASSITLPLLDKGKIPKGINHFRVGEAAFLGTSPLNNQPLLDLHTNAFTFEAGILELYRKDKQPDGVITDAAVGHTEYDESQSGEEHAHQSSYRAIVDFGILDVDADYLLPFDPGIKFFGNSSDLTVYDLGENPNNYETGDSIYFKLKYLALAKLMYSRFVDKVITNDL